MNTAELQKKIILAARKAIPSDAVPYAFEKRIVARLKREAIVDIWTVWSVRLWRAAGPCVAIMLAMSLWAVFSNDRRISAENLASDLEQAVLAPFASLRDSSW